jgi:hypothetical protein
MAEPIAVDLAGAQECKAADMIKFLLAFCRLEKDRIDPVHDEEVLGRAFEEAKKLANRNTTPLKAQLAKL